MKKRRTFFAVILLITFGLSGCQKSPDSSIVVNKDFDKLIDEAEKTGEGTIGVEDMIKYDSYQTTIEDDSLGVTVNVDAKVDIPKTNQLSVVRVKQTPITQDFLDKVKDKLVKGETLYDGSVTNIRSKKDIEQEIHLLQENIEEAKNIYEGGDIETIQQELQRQIDDLQEEYEEAPEEIDMENYQSDGLLHSVKEMYEKDYSNEFYSWEYSLNPDGEVFYGVTDGENGNYLSLYVQNNEDYGNCLRFRSTKHGLEFTAAVAVGGSNLSGDYPEICKVEEGVPDISEYMDGHSGISEYADEAATISQEQAKEIADTFIEEMGLTDFQYSEGDLYFEILDIRTGTEVGYRKTYILRYMRNMDDAFVIFGATGKHSEGWSGESYVKKDWSNECIEFRINDEGIVGFDYNAPLEVTETVVEKSNLKTFDEIKSIFETMVVITNAQEEMQTTIDIDRVLLGYARISEADRFDTGLLVPVWVFEGRKNNSYDSYMTESEYGVILTVNAIDGSVIDSELGY